MNSDGIIRELEALQDFQVQYLIKQFELVRHHLFHDSLCHLSVVIRQRPVELNWHIRQIISPIVH